MRLKRMDAFIASKEMQVPRKKLVKRPNREKRAKKLKKRVAKRAGVVPYCVDDLYYCENAYCGQQEGNNTLNKIAYIIMADDKKKGIVAEFKEFIARGNVVDMAVGVIIGGAFTSIVNSLVNDIFTPFLGMILIIKLLNIGFCVFF